VRNRSLRAVDFAAGQLPAAVRGPRGAAGERGLRGERGPVGPGSTATTFLTPGDRSYTAPADTTQLLVRLWGGGGAGAPGNSWGGGGGGGQAGYAEAFVPADPGDVFTVSVGAGGAGAAYDASEDPTDGASTAFSGGGETLVVAAGGEAGTVTSTCPNSGQPGGAGGGASVTAPAQGLLAIPGADGGTGQPSSFCGAGEGAGGDGSGVDGFPGTGAVGLDADIFTVSESGSPGAAIIVAYTG
jgi:hypothetical protein